MVPMGGFLYAEEVGWMGFRHVWEFNLAMLCKQAWWLVTRPDSLVAKLYKARYFLNTSFFDAGLGANPLFIW